MRKIYFHLIIANLFILTSCTEWLSVQPKEVVSEDEMFKTTGGFYDALYGVYSDARNNYGHNGPLMTGTIEHMAAQWEVAASSVEERIRNHKYADAGEQPFSGPFNKQYKTLVNVNNIIKYLEIQDCLSPKDYNQIKGEALAIRAWLHLDLVRIWGPIPGKNNPNKKYMPYVTDVIIEWHKYYTYVEYMELLSADLDEAESLLKEFEPEQNYRLNYLGVLGLQSRLKIWLQDKEAALAYAEKVISYMHSEENTLYRFAKLDDIGAGDYLFNNEHLFGIHVDFENPVFANATTLYNNAAYLEELFEFSSSDIRTQLWTERKVSGLSEDAKDPLKYLSGEGSVPIVKLPEIYFIAMECGSLGRANELYKEFCASRGIPEVEIESQKQLENILFKEYRKEFFGEGVMFYYYKRHFTLRIPRNPNICTESSYVLVLPKREVDPNA